MIEAGILTLFSILLMFLDRKFNLHYILTGFAIVSLVIAGGFALGLDLGTITPFAILLASFVFTPIVVRICFVLQINKQTTLPKEGDATTPNATNSMEKIENFFWYAPVVITQFNTFVFLFVQAVLFILIITAIWGSKNPEAGHYTGICVTAGYLTSYLAKRYANSGVVEILWGVFGLFIVGVCLVIGTVFARVAVGG